MTYYTDNTIVIENSKGDHLIWLYTGQVLTGADLQELEAIEGVKSAYDWNTYAGTGPYGARTLFVRPDGSYLWCIRSEQSESLDEIIPQIALVAAKALGISLDVLDVRLTEGRAEQEVKGDWVVEAAKKLRNP